MTTSFDTIPDAITTERLAIRRWEVTDAPALHGAIHDSIEHLRPWMEWIKFEPLTVGARQDLIKSWAESRDSGGDAIYGIFRDDEAIGGCGYHRRVGPRALEIGYWIHAGHARQGFATEVAKGLTDAALGLDWVDRIEIHHDKANRPSGMVAKAAGYQFVREVPDGVRAPAETGISWVWEHDVSGQP